MHVNGYAEILSRTLLETSSLGDERTQEVARSLMAALKRRKPAPYQDIVFPDADRCRRGAER